MYRIALLTYSFLVSYFEDSVSSFRDQCNIDILPFDKQHQLLEMIPSLAEQYDGLCAFSTTVERYLRQASIEITKPIEYLDRDSVDFFKAFFILVNENRDVDFSRVLLDTSMLRLDNLRSLADVASNVQRFEENRAAYNQDLNANDFYQLESILEQNALNLWREGRFDMVVCRIASVAEVMKRENIPYVFIYPEKNRIKTTLDSLLNHIRLDKQSEGLPASIMIFPGNDSLKAFHEISYESIRIQRALLEFSKNYTSNFVVQLISQGYEILTSHLIIKRITGNYTCCQLGYYLFSTLGITYRIGYGAGYDISSARQSALMASKASTEAGMSCVVVANGNPIPLQLRPYAIDNASEGVDASTLSRRTGLSAVTLQRISSALQFLGTNDVTNSELAEALQVTVANANRFLNSLVRSGHAEIAETKRSVSKGRPSRVYRIQL